ncbi:MAG: nitroreductase, partial [Actinomycetota bacterium]|nr:nitroreductase [Actinomycetota bacterium]
AHRLAVLSCGTALHHALVSLASDGRRTTVTRLPDTANPQHLATVRVGADIRADAGAIRHLRTITRRHSDPQPALSSPVDADKLRSIAAAARSQGAKLHLLRPLQILGLASAADRAQHAEAEETMWPAVRTAASRRNFGYPGILNVNDTHDRAAVYAVLHGPGDDDLDWLRAGEALSAAWLTAAELDISVVPLSVITEVASIRENVRQLLTDIGYPYLVLRFGAVDPCVARQ